MADAPDDIDRWAQRLAGRGDGGDASSKLEADALRAAVRADDQQLRQAAAGDHIGLQRTLQRLEREGLLPQGDASGTAQTAGRRVVPRRATPWLAIAASVLVVAVALRFMLPGTAPVPVGEGGVDHLPGATPPGAALPGQRPRGADVTVTLNAADPAAEADRIVAELKKIGLMPAASQRPDRMLIDVQISAAQLPAFDRWLQTRARHAYSAGVYRLIVDREASSSGR